MLKRFHSTVHNMLAMYCDIASEYWADTLPFEHVAHNTAYHSDVLNTPHYLALGRPAVLLAGITIGLPSITEALPENDSQYTKQTAENIHFTNE